MKALLAARDPIKPLTGHKLSHGKALLYENELLNAKFRVLMKAMECVQ